MKKIFLSLSRYSYFLSSVLPERGNEQKHISGITSGNHQKNPYAD
ncbi:MAG: hypothetical protein ACK5KN_01200 [Dysgonomonas sp.]|nr:MULTISPECIES: hypothetical protein [unclassified Dysgonomonas]HMM04619.1 hypothetical protein [Dysgonomonas sp.]